MRKKYKGFVATTFFCFIGLFTLYWTTAFPAESYLNGEKENVLNKGCFIIHQKVFFLLEYSYDAGIDELIGVFPDFLLVLILMSVLITSVGFFLREWIKRRHDSG